MFGKPEWFAPRKYSGWGLTPKTWQGWLYVGAIVLPIALISTLQAGDAQMRTLLTLGWVAVICFDVLDIMFRMKKDERDTLHEAISERNAAWAMVAVLALGIAYQAAASSFSGAPYVDPVLIAALFAGLAAKAITNFKLSREN